MWYNYFPLTFLIFWSGTTWMDISSLSLRWTRDSMFDPFLEIELFFPSIFLWPVILFCRSWISPNVDHAIYSVLYSTILGCRYSVLWDISRRALPNVLPPMVWSTVVFWLLDFLNGGFSPLSWPNPLPWGCNYQPLFLFILVQFLVAR